jgi:signal transduction histidine kinase/CheY-like chemotaxis protein
MQTTMSEIEFSEEQQRLATLKSYPIEFETPEKEFDEISTLASIICDKPIALITFVDNQYQWVKSHVGENLVTVDRTISFCNKTILSDEIFEVEDAHVDTLFRNNPLVLGNPFIRFYAGVPLIAPNGHRLGALCVIDKKVGKLTEKQRHALKALSHSVVSLLLLKKNQEQLSQEKRNAEEAVRAKADFLSTMSHEIRTPLNGIAGITHLLLDENPQPHQLEYMSTLRFSVDNLMSIVNDILDFSKIEAGSISFESIPYNLSELLSGIKNANLLKAEDKQIRLKLKRDDDIPDWVIGDPVRLSQVLNNLVSNAIKFTHHGEVVIDLLREKLTEKSASIRFSVKDSGIGIPKDKQDQIFQRFSQVDSSITRKFGGTGLGLAISRKLLELQGSKIELQSELGKGSEFSFTMDFQLPERESIRLTNKGKVTPEVFESLHGARILMVEDNEVNILIAKKIMRNWDVEVTHAANGLEAIEQVISYPFDLILMDIQMPFMDGYEATRNIRAAGYSAEELPIIALSASAMVSEKDQAFNVGMNDFVSKPFNPTELYSKIKKHLR